MGCILVVDGRYFMLMLTDNSVVAGYVDGGVLIFEVMPESYSTFLITWL